MADTQVQANPVEMLQQESAAADASQAPKEATLEDVLMEKPTEGTPEQQQDAQQKPGWIQKRIQEGVDKRLDAAIAKAVEATEARLAKIYEPQLNTLRSSNIKREAQELVASGDVKNIEIATELVRRRYGLSPDESIQDNSTLKNPQPGTTPVTMSDERAALLGKQAEKQIAKGIDVMTTFKNDPTARAKVLSGEWDMYDVAEYMTSDTSEASAAPPPVRKANGGNVSKVEISKMTSDQLKQLDKAIEGGSKFRV